MEKHDQDPLQVGESEKTGLNNRQVIGEEPLGSLHPQQDNPSRAGRHSVDVGCPAVSHDNRESSLAKEERSYSVPILRQDDNQLDPDQPLPIHAPTNVQSSRQRAVRSSAEFDRRFDGPFGRPSLAMTRRISSHKEEALGQQESTVLPDDHGENPATSVGSGPELLEPKPPPLDYTLRTRKMSIFIFWSFIVFDSVVMPIALYFGLWYGVGPGANTPTEKKEVLSANAVFSIVTAAIGGASIVEYAVRFWRLWKKTSTCRVIGARRWYLDLFHWNYSLAWIIVMFELIM